MLQRFCGRMTPTHRTAHWTSIGLPTGLQLDYLHCNVIVGCIAQWLERRSLTGELSLASARSVADV